MKDLINKYFNETLKNASKLLVGTLIAQTIPIVFSFYIARLFSESAFGFYGLYMSTISILVVVVNLKYETTILLPKKEKDANALVGISIFLSFIISLLVFITIIVYSYDIVDFIKWDKSKSWLFIVPLSIFVFGIYQPFNYWLIRNKKYTESSFNKITQRVVETPFNILFGKMNITFGLIYGDLIGRVSMAFQSVFQSIKAGFTLKNISIIDYKKVLLRYKSFPLINSLPSLANSIATHAPLFIVNKFYGIEIAGQLTLVRTVLSIPVSLVSNNISQVVFQQVSERVANEKEFKSILKNIFFLLMGLSTLMIILFIPFGNLIFKLYGTQWTVAGFMSQILVISFAFKFLVSSFSKILLSLEKIKWISYWQISYLLLVISLYYLTKYFNLNVTNFLIAYLIIDIVSYMLYAFFIKKSIKNYHLNL